MNIIVCLDSNNGMMFNKRRQSRDRAIYARIINLIGNGKLWINEYSKPLFENCDVEVVDNCVAKAGANDYAFVENVDVIPYSDGINKIIVYRWNKTYPADRFFPEILLDGKARTCVSNFKGNSHDIIFEEIYE